MNGNDLSMSCQRLNLTKYMKAKLSILMLIGILACCLAGFAQTNAPTGDNPPQQKTAPQLLLLRRPAATGTTPAVATTETVAPALRGSSRRDSSTTPHQQWWPSPSQLRSCRAC